MAAASEASFSLAGKRCVVTGAGNGKNPNAFFDLIHDLF
jgi:hypothetical protein